MFEPLGPDDALYLVSEPAFFQRASRAVIYRPTPRPRGAIRYPRPR